MGYFPFAAPIFFYGPSGFYPSLPPTVQGRGPLIPTPPQAPDDRVEEGREGPNGRASRPPTPGRSNQLVTLGDRHFRANNTKKAEERYVQAIRANPLAAAPRIRMAQIAFVRGNYAEAAHRIREAETAQPGWIATADDIQSIYGEPGDFARHVARLESHLHGHPQDRDAWLVLGAQWYLTGRTAKAADIFRRLDDPDRPPDIALAAFIDGIDARER